MKKYIVGLSLVLLGAGLAGCGSTNGESTSASTDKAATSSTVKEAKTMEVQDSNGKVTVPKNPEKVVVFDNGSLDTLDALGVGDKVVGAATDNLPEYLADYKKWTLLAESRNPI